MHKPLELASQSIPKGFLSFLIVRWLCGALLMSKEEEVAWRSKHKRTHLHTDTIQKCMGQYNSVDGM